MRILLVSALLFFLPGDKFSLIGTWSGHDTHEQDIQLILKEDFHAEFKYTKRLERNKPNQSILYQVHNSANDSLYYLDFEITQRDNGAIKKDTTYGSIKFLDENKILYIEHPNLKSRATGLGSKYYLSK